MYTELYEIYSIQNQIYDIYTESKKTWKHIKLCKVLTHLEIKGDKVAEIAAKKAIDVTQTKY